eukprot:5238450-Prymnesium_polylepis.2
MKPLRPARNGRWKHRKKLSDRAITRLPRLIDTDYYAPHWKDLAEPDLPEPSNLPITRLGL